MRPADLSGEPWIFGGSGPWSEITLTACEAAGFVPEQAHSAACWTAILAMVEAGMGVALVPRMAAERRDGGVMRALGTGGGTDRPRRHVIAAVRRGSQAAPGVARVLDALRDAAAARRPDRHEVRPDTLAVALTSSTHVPPQSPPRRSAEP